MMNFLKFWGTRGSCPVSGAEYSEFGGNTSCLELSYGEETLIFDAGTGIRPLGETLHHAKHIHIFLSHTHWDHWGGFPFFAPIHRKGVRITIWAPEGQVSFINRFVTLFSSDFFPIPLHKLPSQLEFRAMKASEQIKLGQLHLSFHPVIHPSLTLCFKIQTPHQTISYITDNEAEASLQKDFIAFHKNADIFIHETQYTKEEYSEKAGWGHSSLSHVVDLVDAVQPGHWYVTHHDPGHNDEKLRKIAHHARLLLKEKQIPCPVRFVSDGYSIRLK